MKRSSIALLALAAGLVLFLVLAGIGTLILRPQTLQAVLIDPKLGIQAAPADPDADVEERPPTDAETIEFQALFHGLGEAYRDKDGPAVVRQFDVARFVDEVFRDGVVRRPALNRERLIANTRKTLETLLPAENPGWHRAQVKNVKYLKADDAIVCACVRNDDRGSVRKMRWWLHHGPGGWAAYDFEDLHVGMRRSLRMSLTMARADPVRAPWVADARSVLPGADALADSEYDRAAHFLDVQGDRFPKPVAAVFWFMKGAAALGNDKPAEALDHFQRANALKQDRPGLDFMKAVAYNQTGNQPGALTSGRQWLRRFGDDAAGYHEVGRAAEALGRTEEALEAFRSGLADDPTVVANLFRLCQLLPDGQKAETGPWLARVPNPLETFEQLATDALNRDDVMSVEVLVDAVRKIAPDDPAADLYKARVNVRRKRILAAMGQFKAAIARVPEAPKRHRYAEAFFTDMLAAQKPVEAYRVAPDPVAAMHFLAGKLLEHVETKDDLARLRGLVEEHRKRRPDDPWLYFYSGKTYALAQAYDQAEQEFATGMREQDLPEAGRERFREARVLARYQGGKTQVAYERIPPRKATFDQLARLCQGDADVARLEKLVAAHRRHAPDDADLPLWDAEVHWLRRDYAAVVRVLAQHRDLLENPANQRAYCDRRLRSLVRLKRFDDAKEELDVAKTINLLYPAIVYAAEGDLEQTARELELRITDGYRPAAFYSDPDLGAALRTATFKRLRDKYPPPK